MNEENVSYYAIIPADVRYDATLKPNAKLLYGEITALCNQKGYCWASNSYFANLYNVSKETVSRWISLLIKRGYLHIEVIYDDKKKCIAERRIYLTTAIDKNVNTYCQKSQYPIDEKINRVSSKKSIPIDEKVKENNTVNNTSNNKKNNTANTSKIKDDFARLWALYPNKKGKHLAEKAYEKAVKNGVSNDVIEKAIHAFVDECRRNRTESRYIPHGGTWFNQERWNDSYESTDINAVDNYDGGENILDELGDF